MCSSVVKLLIALRSVSINSLPENSLNTKNSALSDESFILKGPMARGLKMPFLNIVSLPKNFDGIGISKLFQSFDLIGLSETRLDSSFLMAR